MPNGDCITGVPDIDVQVDVPFRDQGIMTGSDLREAVALRSIVVDLRSLRTVDADRPGVLFALTMLDWWRIAHIAQDTEASSCPHVSATDPSRGMASRPRCSPTRRCR